MSFKYLTDQKGRVWRDDEGTPMKGQRVLTTEEVIARARANTSDFPELQTWSTDPDTGLAVMLAPVPLEHLNQVEKAKLSALSK